MTDRARANRRPSAAAVLWGSVALFAVLFALLTYQLSSGTDPSLTGATAAAPIQVRKVIKRRIVTTIVPTPGTNSVSAGPASTSETGASAEPVTTSAS